MELRDYLRVMRRYWALVLASLLISLGAGALYGTLATPQYDATVQLYVSVRGPSQDTSDLEQGSSYARGSVQSYVRIVTTASVLQPVIDELALPTTVSRLSEDITAEAPADTSMIEITARNPSPERASLVANEVGRSLTRVIEDELEAAEMPVTGESPRQLVRVSMVDPARIPEQAATPRMKLILAAAGLEGLVLGVALALLMNALDTRVRSAEDVEQASGVPVIGGIPKDSHLSRNASLTNREDISMRAEAYRNIRTNLQFLASSGLTQSKGQAFVLSSSRPAEGKSITTANLGKTLASAGYRVAVVDADLRLPTLAELFGIEGAAGLTDVLIGRVQLEDVMQPWGEFNLHILPSGQVPPNPSELLGREEMSLLIERLRSSHDFILIDSPPLLAVTDAAVVAKQSDGLLLVVSVDGTKKHEVEAAARGVRAAGASLRGAVLNMVQQRDGGGTVYGAEYGMYVSAGLSKEAR